MFSIEKLDVDRREVLARRVVVEVAAVDVEIGDPPIGTGIALEDDALIQRAGNRYGSPMFVGTSNAVRIKALAHNWEFDRIARIDLAILRLAIFEMLHRKDIPPVVSINEAIDLSKQYSTADSKRFINGILDRMKDKLGRDAPVNQRLQALVHAAEQGGSHHWSAAALLAQLSASPSPHTPIA